MNTFSKMYGPLSGLLGLLLVAGCGGGDASTDAQPFPVVITGSLSLDTTNSVNSDGGSAQFGTLTLVSDSKSSTAAFSNTPGLIAPSSSLSGTAIKAGDGIGAHFSMSGNSNGVPATTDGVFSDFVFDLHNPSANDSYRVTFRAMLTNMVSASGADAYAYGDLSFRDAGNNELYFSEHRVDTKTENASNDLDADAAGDVFWIDLAPGATYRFNALQRQRGGTLSSGSYNADIDAFIKVQSVEKVI